MTPTFDSLKAFLAQQGYILERGQKYDHAVFVVRKEWPNRYRHGYKTLAGVLRGHGRIERYEQWAVKQWNQQHAQERTP